MGKKRLVTCLLMLVACIALTTPSAARGQQTLWMTKPKPLGTGISDVALQDGGVLWGQVVDGQGESLERTVVTLRTQNRSVAETHTNNWGQFVVGGLRGGVYELASADHRSVYRLWTEGTAPPSASPRAVLVANTTVQAQAAPAAPVAQTVQSVSPAYAGKTGGLLTRGPAGRLLRVMANNPGLAAVGIASAVAVPTALDKHED